MILDFASLIIAETATLDSVKSDRFKLNRLGNIYYEASQHLLIESQKLLDLAIAPRIASQQDVVIEADFTEFLDGWMRYSVSSNFFSDYLIKPNRNDWQSEATPVLTDKTIFYKDTSSNTLPILPPSYSKIISNVIDIADVEDIDHWSADLLKIINKEQRAYSFSELVIISGLSPARVFLALFLSDCFRISQKFEDDARVLSVDPKGWRGSDYLSRFHNDDSFYGELIVENLQLNFK